MANLYEHGIAMSIDELLATIPESKEKLRESLQKIADKGVRNMSREELKSTGREVIRLARKRMRDLERTGRDDSPAYVEYKKRGLKTSLAGKNINVLKHELKEAFEFLTRKTSLISETDKYNEWLNEHLGRTTTSEQRKNIWKVVAKIESVRPDLFINFGYNETITKIADAASLEDYDVDATVQLYQDFLEGKLSMFMDENDFGKELDEETRTVWMGRGSI